MTKWELATYSVKILTGERSDPSYVWTKKDEETDKSAWDNLTKMAAEGWELVSVTPISSLTIFAYEYRDVVTPTYYLLYTFKRPKP